MNPMPLETERGLFLYRLLPIVYQVRDRELGHPLLALMEVLQSQYDLLRVNMEELYDDWFIATCSEWVVPYLGELLGLPSSTGAASPTTLRSLVANTLAYRRRKGTLAALAHAARDASGWPVFPVVYQDTLGITQSLFHLRLHRGGTADLRDTRALNDLGTPFNTLAHTALIASGPPDESSELPVPSAFNLALVGLSLWRLQSYPLARRTAMRVGRGRYTLHPLGVDTPLFNIARTQGSPNLLPGPRQLPLRISRGRLRENLAAMAARDPVGRAWLQEPPVLAVELKPREPAEARPVAAGRIFVADLSGWDSPPSGYEVAVDPELGRLTVREDEELSQVQVSYAYGLSGDLGGGPYRRAGAAPQAGEWRALVLQGLEIPPGRPGAIHTFPSLEAALDRWKDQQEPGFIEIADNATYESLDGWSLDLQGLDLTITAAEGVFPCLRGDLNVTGEGPTLFLSGLLVDGQICLQGSVSLDVRDCTLRPPHPGAREAQPCLTASAGARNAVISLTRCITGPLRIAPQILRVQASSCLIDAAGGDAVSPPEALEPGEGAEAAPPMRFETSTLCGRLFVQELSASASIFLGRVHAERQEQGGIETSYVPPGSRTPRLYRCQPSLALEGVDDPRLRRRLLLRLKPVFTSTTYGQPGYGQLGKSCAPEIRTGTADGSEMGVFHDLHQPQRCTALRQAVLSYLPWNLDASFIDET